jgi:hypothetical protein
MDLSTLVLIVLVAVLVWRSYSRSDYFGATANDWYVVFDVDADKRLLTLWFYPVVGFRIRDEATMPITSRPSITAKLAAQRPAQKVKDDMWGVSVSYGRWVRDDALFDDAGNPEMTNDNSTFSSIVKGYLLGEFKLHYGTTIPAQYQQLITDAWKRAKDK